MSQIKLQGKAKTAQIDLNAFFYPMHVLQQAAQSFKEVAEISVKQEKGRAKVSIKARGKNSPEETALHFCNYALALRRELGEHA